MFVFALTGCSGTATSSSQSETPGGATVVKVVASTTQICDYITQIAAGGGENSTLALEKTKSDGSTERLGAKSSQAETTLYLTCLLQPNASAHEHEMTQQQSQALSQADLFFVSGVDLEHFLDQAVQSTNFKGTMVVTSGVYGAADLDDLAKQQAKEEDLPYKVDRGIAKVEVAEWPFPPEDGESQPEFRFDPHVWTSVQNAIVQVKNIGNALCVAAPESKELIDKHVESYVQDLQTLDQWTKDSLDSVAQDQRVLFTSHDAFGYFSAQYAIKFEGAALSDFSDQQDATAQKVADTVQKIKASGAVAIFAENSNNPKSVTKVAEAAGVKAIIGDDALYGDSLGEEGSDGQTYIGSILHNVMNLVKAWGGQTAELPQSLAAWAPQDLTS